MFVDPTVLIKMNGVEIGLNLQNAKLTMFEFKLIATIYKVNFAEVCYTYLTKNILCFIQLAREMIL